MRVITGKYKGQKLFTATAHIRPTTDKIKEHIFSIVGPYLYGKNVCDLFSGSGSLGIEAASREAASVTFVEKSFQSIQVLKKNLNRINIAEHYDIIHSNVLSFLDQNKFPFDFIFADPPFKWEKLNELLDSVFRECNLKREGILILESEKSHKIVWSNKSFEIVQQKKFDRSIISFLGWRYHHE